MKSSELEKIKKELLSITNTVACKYKRINELEELVVEAHSLLKTKENELKRLRQKKQKQNQSTQTQKVVNYKNHFVLLLNSVLLINKSLNSVLLEQQIDHFIEPHPSLLTCFIQLYPVVKHNTCILIMLMEIVLKAVDGKRVNESLYQLMSSIQTTNQHVTILSCLVLYKMKRPGDSAKILVILLEASDENKYVFVLNEGIEIVLRNLDRHSLEILLVLLVGEFKDVLLFKANSASTVEGLVSMLKDKNAKSSALLFLAELIAFDDRNVRKNQKLMEYMRAECIHLLK